MFAYYENGKMVGYYSLLKQNEEEMFAGKYRARGGKCEIEEMV